MKNRNLLAGIGHISALFIISCIFACSEKPQARSADHIIPKPVKVEYSKGAFAMREGVTVSYDAAEYEPAARYLCDHLAVLQPAISQGSDGDIRFAADRTMTEGGYRLEISRKGITVSSGSYAGVISAIATLRQMMPATIENKEPLILQSVTIDDSPRFGWRGFMLDCARHFWTKDEVLSLIDLMAQYKLNKFHWHLTDDQGWRIEIDQYPLLTKKGAWRKFNAHDRECIRRAHEQNNEDLLLPAQRLRIEGADTLYGGYYTKADIREVINYAARRGIDVIPEVDMPGHNQAAISCYPWLSCFGKASWGETFSAPLCPGKNSTLEFCKNVYKEIFELFPYEYVNLGADEVEKHNWEKCPHCQKRMRDEGLADEYELQAWFVREMNDFFTENGKKLIGWDEILSGGVSSDATVLWWRAWVKDVPQKAASNGNRLIAAPTEWLYLDNSQSRISLNKSYGFEPVPDSFTADQQKLVMGIQGNLWCEYVPSIRRVQYQMFPRFFAVSELGWTPRGEKDEKDFNRRVLKHYPRLDAQGVNYRIPDLDGVYDRNAFANSARVSVTCPHPDVIIRWSDDGTPPTSSSAVCTDPMVITETKENMMFRAFRPDGSAGDIMKAPFYKTGYNEAIQEMIIAAGGLYAKWYDYKGESCEEIEQSEFKGLYKVSNVSIPDEVKGNIGLIFSGYLDIPVDGVYTFWLNSDDGSTLTIDGEMIVDNDGPHSMAERTGQAVLRAGLHRMEARYFDSNGGGLSMGYINPQGERIVMDESWFKHNGMPE